MSDPSGSHVRCRLGFHKWVLIKVVDPTPEQDRWEKRCRYCEKKFRYWFKEPPFGGGGGV